MKAQQVVDQMFESLSRAPTQTRGSSLDFPPFFLRSEKFHICSSDVDVKGYSPTRIICVRRRKTRKCFCEINNSCVIIIVQVLFGDNDQTQATKAPSMSLKA